MFETHTIKGVRPRPAKLEIKFPYKCFHTGVKKELRGQELMAQVRGCHLVSMTIKRFRA